MLWICLLTALCFESGWPEFRGGVADGISRGASVPLEWAEDRNIAWRVDVPGLGWSSPVIEDGCIFLTTAVPKEKGLSLQVLSMSEKDGSQLWSREIVRLDSAPAIHAKNSHASPTPILHDGFLYVHFGTNGTAKLSQQSGELIWVCRELQYTPVHGCGGSPVLHDDKLFVICDGSQNPFVAAIDARTGRVVWKTLRSEKARISHSFGTPSLAKVGEQWQLLAPGPDHMAAYDVNTGAELWKVRAPGWSVVPKPIIGHGLVFYNHDFDHPELMAVRLGGAGDLTDSHVVWRQKKGAPSTPTPILIGDELYYVSDDGIASCVDAKTGQKHWMERLGGNFSASPVWVGGNLLFIDESGVATWVEASKTFRVVGKNELPGRAFATPAFSGDAMFLRTEKFLYKVTKSPSDNRG